MTAHPLDAPAPPGQAAPAIPPGTPAYTQGLADWAYGPQPPQTPEERRLWQTCFQAHLSQLPPKQRVVMRLLFKPPNYQQVLQQQASLLGAVTALLSMQLIPRLHAQAEDSIFYTLPLSLVLGYGAALLFREYQWHRWVTLFRQLGLRPPQRQRRPRRWRKRP